MAHFTTMTPEALEEWATERFLNRYKDRRLKLIYPKFCKVTDSVRAFEEAWEVSGLFTLALKPEGTPIGYDDPVQGNRTRISHLTYGEGYRVTEEMRDDDRWDVVAQMGDDLLDAGLDHQDRLGHGVLNDATTGSNFTGLDGKSLVNTAHTTLKASGTRSNQLSPSADLTHEAIEALLTQAGLMTDEQGRYIPFKPEMLIIHPSNHWESVRLFNSQYQPGSADNDVNTLFADYSGTKIISTPYLTDADAFFLFDSTYNDVRFFMRKRMQRQTGTDFDTKDMKTTVHYRASTGFWKWEGWYGSPGA
jgi:hypothetical protein